MSSFEERKKKEIESLEKVYEQHIINGDIVPARAVRQHIEIIAGATETIDKDKSFLVNSKRYYL